MCVFSICLPPGRRLLLTPGMGMGGGQLGTLLDHFRTPMPKNNVFQPKINFLEMAQTNFLLYSHDSISALDSHQKEHNINIMKFQQSKFKVSTIRKINFEFLNVFIYFYMLGEQPG